MAQRKARRTQNGKATRPRIGSPNNGGITTPGDSIKAAEDLALSAFASGLKLAAAFGTVAAKTTSIALASIATGADKFSELVKQEAIRSQKANSHANLSRARCRPTRSRLSRQVVAKRRRASRPRIIA